MGKEPYILVWGRAEQVNLATDFRQSVNERIEEGYLPLGGVCVNDHGSLMQAMVLKDLFQEQEAGLDRLIEIVQGLYEFLIEAELAKQGIVSPEEVVVLDDGD